MRLHVGIDIRKYYDYGIGTYIQTLVRYFQDDHELELTYFVSPQQVSTLTKALKGRIVIETAGLYSARELFSLSAKARKSGVHIFHEPHYTFPLFLGVPGVVTIHDIIHVRMRDIFSPLQRLYALTIIAHACRAADAIVVNSQFTKHDLCSLFNVDERKVHVIYLGANQYFFEREDREYIEHVKKQYSITKPYILYVGSLKPHKNIPVLLRAFSRIVKEFDMQLVIVGEKLSQYPEYHHIISNLQRAASIVNPGRLVQREVRALYQGAMVLVLPSYYEGFGLPLVEAMASGIPVIGANTTVIPEIIGDSGYLFDPNDELDLATKIELLVSNADLYHSFSEKAHQRATLFRDSRCAEQTKTIYKLVTQ